MSLDKLRKGLQKDFGKEAVIKEENMVGIEVISSFGSLALDVAMGVGGIPRNRIIEYYGPPSGGKTTLSLITTAETQKSGGVAAFIDLENSADSNWFSKMGVDLSEDKFLLLKPRTGEEALQMIDDCITSQEIDLITLDSIATLATEAEIETDYGTGKHMAQLARLLSDGLKKLNLKMIQNPRATLLLLNQIRSSMDKYKPDNSTGGNALKHYVSAKLRVTRVGGADGILGPKEAPIGFRTRIHVEKSKIGPPKRTVETGLYIGPDKYGIDINEEIIDVAIGMGLIERAAKNKETGELEKDEKGTYYIIEGKQFYGMPKLKAFIEENPEIIVSLKKQVLVFLNHTETPEEDSFNAEIKKEETKTTNKRKSRKKEENNEEST